MEWDSGAIVIGAGVVGLAVARELALSGRDVLVIEAEKTIGVHTSSRNSEVIHAGLYYPQGSLKAQLCVEGRERLYAYCAAHGVPARRIGKLILAADDGQTSRLTALQAQGAKNGVTDLAWLTRDEAQALEPDINCTAALLSPSTGIVDSHALMLALQGDAEAAGAQCAFRSRVTRILRRDGGFIVHADGEGGEAEISAPVLVNCAGHGAHAVARGLDAYPLALIPPRFLARGNYYSVSGRSPFSRLIYPLPVAGGLGVHVTLDLGGGVRLGPDVDWIETLDYTPSPGREEAFRTAVRRYWPGVADREIALSFCGVRPKIAGPGAADADFRVDGPETHGIAGLVMCFGIESPGLTSSLALARLVAAKLA